MPGGCAPSPAFRCSAPVALHVPEPINILFEQPPHHRVRDRLFQLPAEFHEVNLISETEDRRVWVDESTPETRGPMAREREMEVEHLSGHLGQGTGDTVDSREELLQDSLLLLVRPAFTSEAMPGAARSCVIGR